LLPNKNKEDFIMLKGIDENGNMRNIKVTEDGAVVIVQNGGSVSETTPVEIQNENPIPVNGNVTVNNDVTTLSAGVLTLSSTAQTILVNKKVTELSIANYSEAADVTITIGQTSYVVGSNIAVDIPINKTVTSIGLTSTEADTKVQYIVKGEE
jgi:hypothetical protein